MLFTFKRIPWIFKAIVVALLVPVAFYIFIILVAVLGIKTDLEIPYPPTQPLPAEFTTLNCKQISMAYMRSWGIDASPTDGTGNKIQLTVRDEEKHKSGREGEEKARIKLTIKENKVSFTGDNLWEMENQQFTINLNNQNRIAGDLTLEDERTNLVANFMLDKNTSLLIFSYTSTHRGIGESFGSESRLFSCKTQ